ncbi:MAG: hypothetical protein KIT44_07915 [Opitutaceae bacterium]|nr:hypothetical protein [Opitutaceae bacterium]
MSEEITFQPYLCSLGEVIRHEGPHYHIRLADGQVTGIRANGEPSPENVEADIASPAPEPPAVPQEISPAQFHAAARKLLGITEGTVFALISQIPDAEMQDDARDLYEKATIYRRSDPFLNQLAAMNGNTPEQLDEVFRLGATLFR